jgi:hypothetical protein
MVRAGVPYCSTVKYEAALMVDIRVGAFHP